MAPIRGEAVRWYRLAAATGHAQGANNLIAIGSREAPVVGESEQAELAKLAAITSTAEQQRTAGIISFNAALVQRDIAAARLLLEQ